MAVLWEEHKTFEWFSWSKHEKLQLKMWAFMLSLPSSQMEMWTGFTESSKKTDKVPFWRCSRLDPLIENNPADPKGGWNLWGMWWIYALVAHWWVTAAASACVCEPGTVGWRQELPKPPPKGHNRKWNLGVLSWPRNKTESPQWESHLWRPKKTR